MERPVRFAAAINPLVRHEGPEERARIDWNYNVTSQLASLQMESLRSKKMRTPKVALLALCVGGGTEAGSSGETILVA